MIDYILLDLRFFFHKKTILILSIVFLFYVFGTIYASGVEEGRMWMDLYRYEYLEEYLSETLTISKFVLVILVIFTSITMQSKVHQNLGKYLVDRPVKKVTFYISCLLFQLLLDVLYIVLIGLFFAIYTRIFTPYALNDSMFVKELTGFIFTALFYTVFTNTLQIVLPHLLTGILPIGIFWYLEMNQDVATAPDQKMIHLLYKYVPDVFYLSNEVHLYYKQCSVILILLLLVSVGLWIQYAKDIL